MKHDLHITKAHLSLVKNILSNHLKPGTKVWVFGSRAKGNIKPYSDLDLALDAAGQHVPTAVLAALSFDFEESDLPYKVDIVDWNSIDKGFQANISADLVEI